VAGLNLDAHGNHFSGPSSVLVSGSHSLFRAVDSGVEMFAGSCSDVFQRRSVTRGGFHILKYQMKKQNDNTKR
jgi:hypothetical protein